MAYISPSTRSTGDLITAAIWNADVVANSQASVPDIFTTAGDIAYATGADTVTRLAIGTATPLRQMLRVNSGATALEYFTGNPYALMVETAEAEIVSSLAEATLFSVSVPANAMGSNGLLVIKAIFSHLNNSGGDSLTIRVKFGTTTMMTLAVTPSASANRYCVRLEAALKNLTTASQRVTGELVATRDSGVTFVDGDEGTATEDTTSAKTLTVTGQLAEASATLSIRNAGATVDLRADL